MPQNTSRVASLIRRYQEHPGRGGCGVGAVVDLNGSATHDLLEMALRGLGCMEHRGGSLEDTGDGAGLLISTDRDFFSQFLQPGKHLPEGSQLSVGVFFFPHGERSNLPHWQREIDATLRRHGLAPLGWRHVPTDERALGRGAHESRRDIWQVMIGEGMVRNEDLPQTLWRVKAILEQKIHDPYIASFSARTVVYKALATGEQLRRFYLDLQDPALKAEAVVFHRRYSTNTFSNWYLAQVFRTLCHNGEINTIKANRNSVLNLESELGLGPILMPQGSDSADMDRVVELFTSHGVSLLETITRLMPMAWRDVPRLPPEVTRFFQGVQRALGSMGAWEGPAALVAMDGRYVVAALDRMGLRPLRYMLTKSGRAIFGSEIGAINVPFEDVLETGQLDPGEAVAVHLPDRRVLRAHEILTRVVAETPINFAELSENRLHFLARKADEPAKGPNPDDTLLNLFGWTSERVRTVKFLAENAKEQITSMGNDRPLPIMSTLRPPLTKYFKQIVAVVTNPPLDPIREDGAFDLTIHLGSSPRANANEPEYAPLPAYKLSSPIVSDEQFRQISEATGPDAPRPLMFDCSFEDPENGNVTGARAISRRIAEVCETALNAVKRRDASVIILSDMACADAPPAPGEGRPRSPVPMVLVASALHNALVEAGQRRHAGIVVASGDVQEGHDAAVLIANGATAVYPWLFYRVGAQHGPQENLASALDETLKRVMSKMGICSVDGYRGSRLFEAVGLASTLVDHYLPGITSRIGGLELEDIYEDIRARRAAGKNLRRQPDLAVYRKEVWNELQTTARGHDPASYGRFLKLLEETPPVYLRDLLRLKTAPTPLSLDQVSQDQEIIAQVFRGAAMSHGALHRVAHRAIAAAFNQFGASSNCGEGGEDTRRDKDGPWHESRSRIRQVASGRFGVDARYLVHADELSIKIGQGAKPGEGGMLPGAKVTEEVARIRKTQQGVSLISPPPHHDIYSIEDLAQLIYNLRQTNPRAKVSVKIPAVTDIGTIAVGIAKAGADIIDVSGFEGGTGAATSSAIEHAGLPLERALSEVHQALVINNVRDKVRIRADGGLKNGFDIAVVMALGADEISLGTALMIAEQCIFCHGCANGLCPAGITTQNDLIARRLMTEKKGRPKDDQLKDDEELRYEDAKNGVVRYLEVLAKDLREKLAAMGLSRPGDLVGRVDLLERKASAQIPRTDTTRGDPEQMLRRAEKVDLSEILLDPSHGTRKTRAPIYRFQADPTSELNSQMCEDARTRNQLTYVVQNTDRAVGATLAGKIVLRDVPLPSDGFKIKLTGYAGQGFGFACVDGMRMELEGFANDTVAEAMGGGSVVLKPPHALAPDQRGTMSVAGNAAAYGATGGKLFVEGRVGQRVGVRNSGAQIVVEGAGKYAFEYMTGGIGVVLGTVGPVVGSGLTGGVVYLASEEHIAEKVHKNAIIVPMDDGDRERLRALLEEHARETGSFRATRALEAWDTAKHQFVKVVPNA